MEQKTFGEPAAIEKISRWLTSPQGRQAVQNELVKGQAKVEELLKAATLDMKTLQDPYTI